MTSTIRMAKDGQTQDELFTTLTIEDLKLIYEFSDGCSDCGSSITRQIANCSGKTKQRSLDNFRRRYCSFSSADELRRALRVSRKELLTTVDQIVGCVGCRISVERRMSKLPLTGEAAKFRPFRLDEEGYLAVCDEVLLSSDSLYCLLHLLGSKFKSVTSEIGHCKSRRNKRCSVHSLETIKSKALGPKDWIQVWSALDSDCKQEILVIEDDALLDNLETYLRKHKFCGECRNKVLKAFDILIEGNDGAQADKTFSGALYEGFRSCPTERHIHVSAERRLLTRLFASAESEMNGSRRERHAKTLAIAQEEILTCIGLYLYQRFQVLSQTLHLDSLSWRLLFHVGIECLRKNFYAHKACSGDSDIAQLCEELESADRNKREKKQQRRQRWREKRRVNKLKAELSLAAGENRGAHTESESWHSTAVAESFDFVPDKSCYSGRSDQGYCSGSERNDSQSLPDEMDSTDRAAYSLYHCLSRIGSISVDEASCSSVYSTPDDTIVDTKQADELMLAEALNRDFSDSEENRGSEECTPASRCSTDRPVSDCNEDYETSDSDECEVTSKHTTENESSPRAIPQHVVDYYTAKADEIRASRAQLIEYLKAEIKRKYGYNPDAIDDEDCAVMTAYRESGEPSSRNSSFSADSVGSTISNDK